MNRIIIVILIGFLLFSCGKKIDERTKNFPKFLEIPKNIPNKNNIWVFILAGQSNMAGRGLVEPKDTISNQRILTINKDNQIVFAKEPLHFYEPSMTGLDCGLSFAKKLIEKFPDSISILIIPTAVGGTSISQWIGDSLFRNVQLLSNFKEKVEFGNKHGIIKAILWHQGENDGNQNDVRNYKFKLSKLFTEFRKIVGNDTLPILIGELGIFPNTPIEYSEINKIIYEYALTDNYIKIIRTNDLKDKEDNLHFNSESQRIMGQRFSDKYLEMIKSP